MFIPPVPLIPKPETSEAQHAVGFKLAGEPIGKRHRIGGTPEWIQGEDIPACSCGKPMDFYGQLDSLGDDPLHWRLRNDLRILVLGLFGGQECRAVVLARCLTGRPTRTRNCRRRLRRKCCGPVAFNVRQQTGRIAWSLDGGSFFFLSRFQSRLRRPEGWQAFSRWQGIVQQPRGEAKFSWCWSSCRLPPHGFRTLGSNSTMSECLSRRSKRYRMPAISALPSQRLAHGNSSEDLGGGGSLFFWHSSRLRSPCFGPGHTSVGPFGGSPHEEVAV